MDISMRVVLTIMAGCAAGLSWMCLEKARALHLDPLLMLFVTFVMVVAFVASFISFIAAAYRTSRQ